MKTVLLAFLALLLFTVNAPAQFVWQKTYGPFSEMSLNKMIPMSDGGYLMAGRIQGPMPIGISPYLVRTNASGDTLWTRYYQPPLCDAGSIADVAEDYDGNIIIAGGGHGPWSGGPFDNNGFLYKLNPMGDTIWTKRIVTPQTDRYRNVVIGHDSTYLAVSIISGVYSVQKISKSGTILWNKLYPFSPSDSGRIGYLQAVTGGYYVFVHSNANETKIFKIDGHGNEQYSKKNKMGQIYDISIDASQNLIICSSSRLFKLNPVGDTLWSKIYKKYNNYVGLRSAQPTSDGNYILFF